MSGNLTPEERKSLQARANPVGKELAEGKEPNDIVKEMVKVRMAR